MEVILAAIVSGVFAIMGTVVTWVLGKKINETHRQVTVNHHSSENPTILDQLSDIKSILLEHVTDKRIHKDK